MEKLENQQAIIKNLTNLSKSITRKAGKGKIGDVDAQMLIDLLAKIEAVI